MAWQLLEYLASSKLLLRVQSAYHQVDHVLLLHRLEVSYGIGDAANTWFASYPGGRWQYVRSGRAGQPSQPLLQCCLVFRNAQSSDRSSFYFTRTADLIGLVENHELPPHLYANKTQIFGICRPGESVTSRCRVSACIDDVSLYECGQTSCNSTVLKPRCASARRQRQIPDQPMMERSDSIQTTRSVRDLGIHLEPYIFRCGPT